MRKNNSPRARAAETEKQQRYWLIILYFRRFHAFVLDRTTGSVGANVLLSVEYQPHFVIIAIPSNSHLFAPFEF